MTFRVGIRPSGLWYERTPDHLLRHHLFEGASGSGKTSAARDALAALFRARPDVPMLVLDGVGTLTRDLAARIFAWIERCEVAGQDMTAARARVLFLTIQPENESGVAFDLTKRRKKVDSHGFVRRETVHERVDAIMATLAHTTEGSEDFRLVQTYGTAGFACLVAAQRPVTELPLLLSHGNELYRAVLWEQIMAAGLDREPWMAAQMGVLNVLFATTARSPVQFHALTGSTLRNFAWLTTEYAAYFGRDTVDYGAFHDAGGVLLVDPGQANPSTAGMFRRALYGIRNAHIAARASSRPSLVVIDEQQGMNADLYALHVAMARNRGDFHWFLFQTGRQIGEKGSHYDEILSAMQHRVFFRPGSFDSARNIATQIRRASLDGTRLTSTSRTAGWHYTGEGAGESGGETQSEERIRISEQLDAQALTLLALPIGTAYHIPEHRRAIRVEHRHVRISPEAYARVTEAKRLQYLWLHEEPALPAAPDAPVDVPPPVTDAPPLPKTRKDRGKRDPKRRAPVDDEGGPTA